MDSHRTVIVKRLSDDVTEDELRDFFRQLGAIESVRLKMDRETGKPLGFAYVTFQHPATAEAAVKAGKVSFIDVELVPMTKSSAQPSEKRKKLNQVWEDLQPRTAVPPLEEYKIYVYDEIERAMTNKKKQVVIEVNYHRVDILDWLVNEHKLKAEYENVNMGYNPSTHEPVKAVRLVVKWG